MAVKKRTLFFGGFAALFLALVFFFVLAGLFSEPEVITVRSADVVVEVEVADTPIARERGLSDRPYLPWGTGMLFVFEEAGNWGIWMKDMNFPIDIIWMEEDGTIITIEHNVSPSTYPEAFYPASPTALYVLEVPAGFAKQAGLAEGAEIVVK